MAGESVLAARRPPDGPVLSQSSLPTDMAMFRTQEREPQVQKTEEILLEEELEEKAMVEEAVEVEAEEAPDVEDEVEKKDKEERDPDVSDQVWEELERTKEAHAAHLEALRRARKQAKLEEEIRRAQAKLEEEARRAKAIQEKIRQICPCPAGFNWYKSGAGWRCGGGSHFVSDEQLNRQFTC